MRDYTIQDVLKLKEDAEQVRDIMEAIISACEEDIRHKCNPSIMDTICPRCLFRFKALDNGYQKCPNCGTSSYC
jgi:hypothetical protein